MASAELFPDRFQTERLILRPIAPSDARSIFDEYAQDPAVTRFLTWQPHRTIADTEAYIAQYANTSTSRTYVLLGRQDPALRGAFDLRDTGPGRVGYGYVLARRWWGHGLMAEALQTVAEWALAQPGIWRIGDVCDVDNRASARVMEKAGLACEGRLRRWGIHPNISPEPRDCFSYARVR